MPSNNYPILDGIAPSWADLGVFITAYKGGLSIETKDISALSSGVTVEVGEQRGTGGQLRRRTRGQGSNEGSITFYRPGFQKFIDMLETVAPKENGEGILTLVHFDIVVQHILPESSEDTRIYEYKILGARGLGDSKTHAEGTDAEAVEVPLSIAKIINMANGRPVRWI